MLSKTVSWGCWLDRHQCSYQNNPLKLPIQHFLGHCGCVLTHICVNMLGNGKDKWQTILPIMKTLLFSPTKNIRLSNDNMLEASFKNFYETTRSILKRLWTGDQNAYLNIFWVWSFLVKIFTEIGGHFFFFFTYNSMSLIYNINHLM